MVRPVQAADASALVPLFAEWEHTQPAALIAAQLGVWEEAPFAEVLVSEVDECVVGLVAVLAVPHLARPGRLARVMGLVVSSGCRRQGLGAALMGAAEGRARQWGCDYLEVTSSRSRDAAHAFYVQRDYQDRSAQQARYVRQL